MMSDSRRLFLFLALPALLCVPVHAEIPGFPADGLEDRIEFWEKVFTIYGRDDLIIHDTERVNLIYHIATEQSRNADVERVRRLLEEVRVRIDDPGSLSPDGRRLYDSIAEAGVNMTAGNIAVLRDRIHVQRGIKERFRDGVVRSGRYLPYFRQVFEEEGVPLVLTLLPLVESSFENAAYSRAGAAGIWQFMPATARSFMQVTRGRDDRLNPAIATRSAARLLRGNYQALGAWPLAVTAYNHGRAGMARAKAAHGSDMATIIRNYDGRTFGYASKNFYPEFLAAVRIYENYEFHFGPLALDAPQNFAAPAVRTASIGPVGDGQRYQVRPGDSLSLIAARHGTTVSALMTLNGLPGDTIFAGETLLVAAAPAPAAAPASPGAASGEYRVRRGDTLSTIAARHSMGVQTLMSLNNLRSSTIYEGQTLVISGETRSGGEYQVRRGDTLSAIARQFGIEIRELMELNGLLNNTIYAGQLLVIP